MLRQTNDPGEPRSPTFVGKVFSLPGGFGDLGMGREPGFDACSAQSFQSRRWRFARAANRAGTGYRAPPV
ncbi:hypothetical protein XI03_05675 [Bradyrhizobium sp. CCBAU 65884]|nr:hypothetical protein [Bradyrhizobium sp. CCBAU 65884]